MIVELLDNTRKINKLLKSCYTSRIEFDEFSEALSTILRANVLVISANGKILANSGRSDNVILADMLSHKVGSKIDKQLNERLLNILSTKENVNLRTLGFDGKHINSFKTMIIPVDMAGKRLATIFIYRDNDEFLIEDIIIGEYSSTVIALEMTRSINDERLEQDRKYLQVEMAIGTLSYSEKSAIKHILVELGEKEGIIVASKVADKYSITRSLIVNAIRKCESAGVIDSKSLGMKGTYVKVTNEHFLEKIK